MDVTLTPIAYIRSDFKEKFGIPRQAGLVPELEAAIEFVPEFRSIDAVRGLEEFSYVWLIWGFHKGFRKQKKTDADQAGKSSGTARSWSPTVRPPRLGGKVRIGVFATRSPNRPNPIGLSSVRIIRIETEGKDAPRIIVGGADLLDGTPIYDIKPYIPYGDCHPDAKGGFTDTHRFDTVDVDFPEHLLHKITEDKREALLRVLAQDPRGAYEKKADYIYGLRFDCYDVRFTASTDPTMLHVVEVVDTEDTSFRKVKT